MKKLFSQIARFFWPSSNESLAVRLAPYAFMGAVSLLVLVVGIGGWTYSNSTPFCGLVCHSMPPSYHTYLKSPHSRVDCVECHLGREIITKQLPRKIEHAWELPAEIFKLYEFPLHAHKMRPAADSCETCHYPRKFNDDIIKEIRWHASDEANTPQSTLMMVKVGGGAKRIGLGKGIHWHTEQKVEFIYTDEHQQVIPYVRVTDSAGKVTEYFDLEAGFTPDQAAGKKTQLMDCISCHNRETHLIPYPEDMVDQALFAKSLSANLPYLRKNAIALLSAAYPDQDAAARAFATLDTFYKENYPDIYKTRQPEIRQAMNVLKGMYDQIRYPEYKLDWTTHADNVGHTNSPGCFRCHDGKHVSASGAAVRMECNLCHSIPVKTDPSKYTTEVKILRGAEPASHTSTHWISLHGKVIDATCAGCHSETNPPQDLTRLAGKKPPEDGTFCGNAACHGGEWKYAGLRSKALEPILQKELQSLKK